MSSYTQRDSETLVICQVPLALSGSSFEEFNTGGFIINVGVVIIYFVTFLKLRSLSVHGRTRLNQANFKNYLITYVPQNLN